MTRAFRCQLKQVLSYLKLYLGRFWNCLGAGNRRYIQTLIVLIQSFLRLLLGCQEDSSGTSNVTNIHMDQATEEKNFGETSMTINEFLFSLNIDNINLVKLRRYVKESNIIHKVRYADAYPSMHFNSQLMILYQFLRSLDMELNLQVCKVVTCILIARAVVQKEV